jgi:hypothetical protein
MGGANTTSDSQSDHHRRNKSKKSRRKHYSSDDSIVKEAEDYLKQKLTEGNAEALQALAPSSSSDTSSDRQKARKKKHSRKYKSSKHNSHRHPLPTLSPPPSSYPILTEDDYFTRNTEFSSWLRQQKDIYFNDLDTETARRLFIDFTYLWNKGLLYGKYYHTIDEKDADKGIKQHHHRHQKTGFSRGLKPEIHNNSNATATVEDRRAVRKLERKQEKELLNELVPKAPAGTQEARAQAQAGRLEEKRMREESPDYGRLVDVMGGGGDDRNDPNSFARVKERVMAKQAARDGKLAAKRAELEVKLNVERAKEEERMAGFRALISQSSAGGGLVIPKRND